MPKSSNAGNIHVKRPHVTRAGIDEKKSKKLINIIYDSVDQLSKGCPPDHQSVYAYRKVALPTSILQRPPIILNSIVTSLLSQVVGSTWCWARGWGVDATWFTRLCAALGCSGLLWAALGCFGLLWAALGCLGGFVMLWAALNCFGRICWHNLLTHKLSI